MRVRRRTDMCLNEFDLDEQPLWWSCSAIGPAFIVFRRSSAALPLLAARIAPGQLRLP
jgi:hypothetical protein